MFNTLIKFLKPAMVLSLTDNYLTQMIPFFLIKFFSHIKMINKDKKNLFRTHAK